jgi:putative SOS response-associated peptidase YedK
MARFWAERFRTKRCIVPADTFFEWIKVQKGAKPKYEFSVPAREPFGMAGVWSAWKNPRNETWEDTFAILTGDANSVMRPVHDRQPIILEPREYEEYLSPGERPPIHLLRSLPDEELKAQLIFEDNLTQQQASLFDSL